PNGAAGYLPQVYVAPAYRGGQGLPACRTRPRGSVAVRLEVAEQGVLPAHLGIAAVDEVAGHHHGRSRGIRLAGGAVGARKLGVDKGRVIGAMGVGQAVIDQGFEGREAGGVGLALDDYPVAVEDRVPGDVAPLIPLVVAPAGLLRAGGVGV